MAKIELRDVSYVYSEDTPFEKTALNNVTLSIPENSVTGIIGHTGSGKSTLVQLLNGLLKPEKGEILLDGKNIWAEPKKISRVRFKVGLVFQYPEYQLFEESVRADIAYGPKNMGLSQKEIEKRVEEAARFCGIAPEILDKSPFELSGGQQRRVAIAGIMAMTPEVLVLDEPAAGLDPKGREEIFGGISEYQKNTGATVIIVSHSMEDIARYCDNVVVMKGGGVLRTGSCEEIFSHSDELIEAGLDIPQISSLVRKLIKMGVELPQNIYTVEGAQKAILSLMGKGESHA